VPLYVAKTAERAYTEPRVSTMAAVQGLGNRVADSASRAGTTGDWSAQAERVRSMRYEDWLRGAGPDADSVRGQLRAPYSQRAAIGKLTDDQRVRHSAAQI